MWPIFIVVIARTTTFDIFIEESTWDTMASCTYGQYRSHPRPEHCDYQPAECSYNNEARVECKVRRKGGTTWRDMGDKPSIKIKKMKTDHAENDDYIFGTYTCAYAPNCNTLSTGSLHGSAYNLWQTEKVTLNNQIIRRGDVDANTQFRQAGIIAPLSKYAIVQLFRGADLIVGPVEYAMIETISDKAFMKKYFGSDYVLWEVAGISEYKRSGGVYKTVYEDGDINCDECAPVTPNCSWCAPSNLTSLSIQNTNRDAMLRYWAAELITNNWDGACLSSTNNNHFIALTPSGKYTFIPHGLDQAFYCKTQTTTATCSPIIECLSDTNCTKDSNHILNQLQFSIPPRRDCAYNGYRNMTPDNIITASVLGGVCLLLLAYYLKYNRSNRYRKI